MSGRLRPTCGEHVPFEIGRHMSTRLVQRKSVQPRIFQPNSEVFGAVTGQTCSTGGATAQFTVFDRLFGDPP